jgi:cytochrome c-type biogenesis protein
MELSHVFSALLAGLLTSLSPCVLSALPLVITSSLGENKKGPLFLVAGLITSFVILGVAFALSTSFLGLERESIQKASGILFIILGAVFLFDKLYQKLAQLLSPIANKSNSFLNNSDTTGLIGQFFIGFFLGMIWSPCSGPTLGLALTLVSKQQAIFQGALLMFVFGLAASSPLLFMAFVSKKLVLKNFENINNLYANVKKIMGFVLLTVGILAITGLDKSLEAFLIANMPEFLLDLITRY